MWIKNYGLHGLNESRDAPWCVRSPQNPHAPSAVATSGDPTKARPPCCPSPQVATLQLQIVASSMFFSTGLLLIIYKENPRIPRNQLLLTNVSGEKPLTSRAMGRGLAHYAAVAVPLDGVLAKVDYVCHVIRNFLTRAKGEAAGKQLNVFFSLYKGRRLIPRSRPG